VARERQHQRFAGLERLVSNGDMGTAEILEICVLDNERKGLLRVGMQQLQLSAYAYGEFLRCSLGRARSVLVCHFAGTARILRLARTITDLPVAYSLEGGAPGFCDRVSQAATAQGKAAMIFRYSSSV